MKHPALILAVTVLAGCTATLATGDQGNADAAREAAMAKYDFGKPYIGGPLPGGADLVPPPPAAGSPMEQRDQQANETALALQGSARWALAARDADLTRGAIGRAFSCAAGLIISDETTPRLAHLLRRAGTDFAFSTSGVKELYQRPRPFMVNQQPSCTPQEEEALRGNGAYPSGHSAMGYGEGLVLASILPERAATLVARGRAFGDSRRVCNIHWLSDVEEGRVIATATFARMQTNADFRADVAAARAEIAELGEGAAKPQNCEAEAATLADG
ncbi:MAG: phosphatase PAP2 family protein [Sphingomonadaceae bacterium]|nr:phosphatase PAP2 family protein [Sphingomonadaceae bacterium]